MANPLVAADESTSGHFVTCGMTWAPPERINECLERLRGMKRAHGVSETAEIHCRVLFHHHARAKSEFRGLSADDVLSLISDCVTQMSALGVRWFGMWCDKSKYPSTLRMLDGTDFIVTDKHIAGLLVGGCTFHVESVAGAAFDLIYDRDPTLIDWGVAAKMQATHFARVSAHATNRPECAPFLEMADVAAHLLARVKSAAEQKNAARANQLLAIFNSMQMSTANFSWRPNG
jgi:hypothetical protein